MDKERYRVIIRCHSCGEKFFLRGTIKENGDFETGFKKCICGNETDLYIDIAKE